MPLDFPKVPITMKITFLSAISTNYFKIAFVVAIPLEKRYNKNNQECNIREE